MLSLATYKRTRHARMTRSLLRVAQALPGHDNGPGADVVLKALRYMLKDGETRQLSQADIADVAGCSEGTVAKYMPRLAQAGLIERTPPAKAGRGNGYTITMLPPPELRVELPRKGSFDDPSTRSLNEGTPLPQTAPQEGSSDDPSNDLVHDHEQQQHGPPPELSEGLEDPPIKELLEAIPDVHPKVVER